MITLLIGALVASSYKWGYFVFSLLALFAIAYHLLWSGRRYATRFEGSVGTTYTACAAWLMGFWFIYPICWGLSEGGNRIGVVGEMIFYGILDLLTKLGFIALLLFGHRRIDPATLGVAIRDYDDEAGIEKRHHDIGGPVPAAAVATPSVATTSGANVMGTNVIGSQGGVVEPRMQTGGVVEQPTYTVPETYSTTPQVYTSNA